MTTEAHTTPHAAQILPGGHAFFDALIDAIGDAHQEIYFAMYIFRIDTTGKRVLDALAAAVARGVKVFLIIDGLGSIGVSDQDIADIRASGINAAVYRRLRRARFRRFHARMHLKIVAIDQHSLFIGGHNVGDEYAGLDVPGAYFDISVRVDGAVAADAAGLVARIFERTSTSRFRAWRRFFRPRARAMRSESRWRLVVRDNVREQRAIEQMYDEGIASARVSITMAHAYFLPSRRIITDLCRAVRRGVKVALLLQGTSDHPVLTWAERGLYNTLLRAGVEIYEYRTRVLHSKVATVDDRWCTIGSSNLEPWSLRSNLEANVSIDDEQTSRELRELLMRHAAEHCEQVTPAGLPWWRRALAFVSYRLLRASFVLTGGQWDPGSA